MSILTMNEKDAFISTFEHEFRTSLRVLKSFPADQLALQPKPHMNPALRIAWMLVLNQMVLEPTLHQPELSPGGLPEPAKTMPELIAAFEKAHAAAVEMLLESDDAAWNTTVKMPVGPKQMGDVRRADALWMFLHDTIHHRGQLSVYLRLAGGKLPSIYGPTADEPWN